MILKPTKENIEIAAASLLRRDLVAFPTETVYGLGANAKSPESVKKIFEVKGRPSNNPLIVHVADIYQIEEVADLSSDPRINNRLSKIKDFWPGPLSVVLPKSKAISNLVSGGGNTVAVRIPKHPVALSLLKESRLPLAAPSANPSGYISPTTADHVERNLGGKVRLVLDGGACEIGLESSVISLLGDTVTLLRPGIISKNQLEEALGESITAADSSGPLLSPGRLAEHYAPRTPLKFLEQLKDEDLTKRVGVILLGGNPKSIAKQKFHTVITLSVSCNYEEIASKLYAALHEMDGLSLDLIAIERCEDTGLGMAVMDRLRRATR